jgi:hypothetical protein
MAVRRAARVLSAAGIPGWIILLDEKLLCGDDFRVRAHSAEPKRDIAITFCNPSVEMAICTLPIKIAVFRMDSAVTLVNSVLEGISAPAHIFKLGPMIVSVNAFRAEKFSSATQNVE